MPFVTTLDNRSYVYSGEWRRVVSDPHFHCLPRGILPEVRPDAAELRQQDPQAHRGAP